MSRPIPFELAKLRGNPSERPLRPGPLPARTETPPEPPSHLSEGAAAEWRRLAPDLWELNLLSILDHSVFALFCTAYARWMEAERLLESEGLLAKGSRKNAVVHPLTKIATQSARDVCKLAAEFGMTPCGRARLRAGYDGGGGPSKFGDLLA
jgi:P27 family predicted phage terminase small subunit